MEASKKEDNSTNDSCSTSLKLFQLPQVIDGDCRLIDGVAAQIFSDLLYALTFISLVVNIIKIVSTAQSARSWTNSHIYLVNIAVAHIIFLMSCPFWGMYLSQQYDWNLGRHTCSAFNFTSTLGHVGSVLFICVICIDRMLIVCCPVTSIQFKNVTFAKMVVITSWALSTVVATLSYVYTGFTSYGQSKHFCGSMSVINVPSLASVRSFILFMFPNIFIPTFVLLPCYARIMIYLFCQHTRLPCDMGKAVKLDITYITSFVLLCLSSSYTLIIVCSVYLASPACEDECVWANVINMSNETARLMNICNALIAPLIYLFRFRLHPCTNFCDYSNVKLCSCDCSQQVPTEGIQAVQLVYISCATD